MTATRASTTAASRPSLKLGTHSIKGMGFDPDSILHHGAAEVLAGVVGDGAVVAGGEQGHVGALAGLERSALPRPRQGGGAIDGGRGPGLGGGEVHAAAGEAHDQ